MDDGLFGEDDAEKAYDASAIEVLEGLEPVRKRPGMYIGGTDERALHHLVAEVLDNSMDEAVAGHASRIEVELASDGSCTITDNGRGIPVDPHPKFPDKSALEVILTTLHAGGKFSDKAYETSGGLHGVGVSVVNALSDHMRVEVARGKKVYAQEFSRGLPQGALAEVGVTQNRRGTAVTFHPDALIFGPSARLKPARLHKMGAVQGIPVPRRRDPMEMRARTDRRQGRDPGGGHVPLSRRAGRLPDPHLGRDGVLWRGAVLGQGRFQGAVPERRGRIGGMGRCVDPGAGRRVFELL